MTNEHLEKEFQEINPRKILPTLQDGLYITWSSKEIAKYLVFLKSMEKTMKPTSLMQYKEMEEMLDFDLKLFRPTVEDICVILIHRRTREINYKIVPFFSFQLR